MKSHYFAYELTFFSDVLPISIQDCNITFTCSLLVSRAFSQQSFVSGVIQNFKDCANELNAKIVSS